jgi:hypothetical protein
MKFKADYHTIILIISMLLSGHLLNSTTFKKIDFHYETSESELMKVK